MSDPIANMLTIIRNAQAVKKETVSIPYSKFKMEIARAFEKNNFIKNAGRHGKKEKKYVEIELLYNDDNKEPAIQEIKSVSKGSRRIYMPVKDLKKKRRGVLIVSTPKGVMGDKEAVKENVGGEVICEIY